MTTRSTTTPDEALELWAFDIVIQRALGRTLGEPINRAALESDAQTRLDAIIDPATPPSLLVEHALALAVDAIRLGHDATVVLAIDTVGSNPNDAIHETVLELLHTLKASQ